MKKFFSDTYIYLLGVLTSILPLLVIFIWEHYHDIDTVQGVSKWVSGVNLSRWASLATYLSIGMSVTTVVFVMMTYYIQSRSSVLLQFDATFFQWFSIFHSSLERDAEAVNQYAEVVSNKLQQFDSLDCVAFPEEKSKEERICVIHYKTLFQMTRYIETSSSLRNADRKKYFDIIQSQLSDEQMLVLLYLHLQDTYPVCKMSYQTFIRKHLDKYKFFKNVYYKDTMSNYPVIRDLMFKAFPNTRGSFHWFPVEEKNNFDKNIK